MKDELSESQETILASLKPKKRKNSRAKGNAFENKVSKILNERFDTDEFSRSPGSGAFATTHKLPSHLQIYGDLISPQDFKFIVECKKGYNQLGMDALLNRKSKVWEWIETLERDMAASRKPGFILTAQDRKPSIVITPYNKQIDNHTDKKVIVDKYIMIYLEDFLSLPDTFFLG